MELFEDCICALANDRHYLNRKDLISLNCGHSVCGSCFNSNMNQNVDTQPSNCKKCDKAISKKEDDGKSAAIEKQKILDLIPKLICDLELKINEELDQFYCDNFERQCKIEKEIEYWQEEIDIRVESLRQQFDEIYEIFYHQIQSARSDRKEFFAKFFDKFQTFEDMLETFHRSNGVSVELANRLADYLEEIVKSFMVAYQGEYWLKFNHSEEKIKEEILGKVVYLSQSELEHNIKVFNALTVPKKGEVFLKVKYFRHVCQLPMNKITVICFKKFSLYDAGFNLKKRIEYIRNKIIFPFGFTFNDENLFLTDSNNSQVIKMDYNCKVIKTYGSAGDESNEFNIIQGIFWHRKKLYICDNLNKRIHVLTDDLNFIELISLPFCPKHIYITDTVAFITGFLETHFLYIYNLNDWTLKSKFCSSNQITKILSLFYSYNRDRYTLQCFNSDGEIIEEFYMSKFKFERFPISFEAVFLHNNALHFFPKSGKCYKLSL